MEVSKLQIILFERIKESIPPHLSFVDEVGSVLNISNDSAYRRIRGEKPISFEEACKMAGHFKLSLDQFLKLEQNAAIFSTKYVRRDEYDIESYLSGLVEQLTYFNSFKERDMLYHNKDIPVFYHFMFPELASFKCYFWSRYNLNYQNYNKGLFAIEDSYRCLITLPRRSPSYTRKFPPQRYGTSIA